MDLMSIIYGTGIMGLLISMSKDLGQIRGSFESIQKTLADHAGRILKLEQEKKGP